MYKKNVEEQRSSLSRSSEIIEQWFEALQNSIVQSIQDQLQIFNQSSTSNNQGPHSERDAGEQPQDQVHSRKPHIGYPDLTEQMH